MAAAAAEAKGCLRGVTRDRGGGLGGGHGGGTC